MKILSEYMSDDTKRKAIVFIQDKMYYVRATADTGTPYVADFHNEELAENFAEDWVLKK